MLTRADKTELVLITAGVGTLALTAWHLPSSLSVGSFLVIAALALLGQGLVRDLVTLIKGKPVGVEHQEEARCMCAESTVGLAGVLTGVFLTVFAVSAEIRMAEWAWPLAGGLIWVVGFIIKDVVIEWAPWKLRRVKDHGSILVRWR